MGWSQIWKDQGMNGDDVHFEPLSKEEVDRRLHAMADDIEQNWEVVYERQEDGLEHPVLRRKDRK